MKTYKCEAYGLNGEVFEVELLDRTEEHKLVFKQPERLNPEDPKYKKVLEMCDSLNTANRKEGCEGNSKKYPA